MSARNRTFGPHERALQHYEQFGFYDFAGQPPRGQPSGLHGRDGGRKYLNASERRRVLADVLRKSRFWEAHAGEAFNERQRHMINRLLDGFEGKLNTSKWAALTKTSTDTAFRDIDDLFKRGILVRDAAGGRSTRYSLAEVGE